VGIRNWVRGSVGQSELGAEALLKAVWWDLRLASPLTHVYVFIDGTFITFNVFFLR